MTKRIGKYEVIKKLASGGFGVTYLAIDTTTGCTNSPCVIKQYHPLQKFDSDLDADMKRRFRKEAEILRNLGQSCKQIPKLLDEFSEDAELYLVQEFIEGETLDNKVRNEGKFSEKEAKKILVSLLSVIQYIHSKNIIHRDISPDNIIIRDKDQKPVLIDFGAVKEVVSTVLDSKGFPLNLTIAIGKKNYSPPEQLLDSGLGEPKFQSDIYSLALTIFF